MTQAAGSAQSIGSLRDSARAAEEAKDSDLMVRKEEEEAANVGFEF